MATVKRPAGRGARTASGASLDAEAERQLSEEAEAGFDPDQLIRRPVGRPSLSGRAGHSNRVDLRVDDATYQAIRRIADAHNRKISDVVRDAIRSYLAAS